MKSTVKKIAASLLALLMMIQMVPALAATYSSGMIVGSDEGYKEALAIVGNQQRGCGYHRRERYRDRHCGRYRHHDCHGQQSNENDGEH